MHNEWKGPLCSLRTMLALISLGLCPGWPGPSLSAYRITGYCCICQQTVKAQIRLHGCACWSGPTLSANCIRTLFVYCASYGHEKILCADKMTDGLIGIQSDYHRVCKCRALLNYPSLKNHGSISLKINPNPVEPGYTLPLQTVLIQISWLLKKPTDLDQHCLSFSMWICVNNLDQVIWLAENWKWVWYLNLFSMIRVKNWIMLVLYCSLECWEYAVIIWKHMNWLWHSLGILNSSSELFNIPILKYV